MIQTVPAQTRNRPSTTRLRHLVCPCHPEVARCGTRTTGRMTTVAPPAQLRCVVCADLHNQPCRFCGI